MNNIHTVTLMTTLALSISGCLQVHDSQSTSSPTPVSPSATILQVIQLGDTRAQNTKQFSGVVHAQAHASLAFRVPGTLSHIAITKGDTVKQGQVIATLDPHDYQVALETLQAQKLEALSAHKLAKAELKRVKQAINDDAIASVTLDRAVSGYERSLSAVKVINKHIQRAKDTLSYTQLTAPFDGVIGRVNVEAHEHIVPGIALATLQDHQQLEVDIDVPESLIHAFRIGQRGTVSWYHSQEMLHATVSEIDPLPHRIKQTYTVTYHIDQGSAVLFPGKSVSLTTQLGDAQPDHCVPYAALVGEQEKMHVNVVRDHTVIRTPVTLNTLDAYQACVTGALQHDDYVVVSGSHYLTDGQRADNLVVRRQ